MTVLWQSSWFWLMICTLLLILAGCALFNGYNNTRQTDNIPLINLTNTPFSPLLSTSVIQTPFYPPSTTLRNNQQAPPSEDILVDTPDCYSLSSGELSCLGQIWNTSTEEIGDTEIHLSFFDSIGHKIGEQTATSEQRITPPGSFAPYRAILNADLASKIDNNTHISHSVVSFPAIYNIHTLDIVDSRGSITAGRYNLTVTIQNDSGFDAQEIRLFTTLSGDKQEIIGYQVYEVGNILENGEQQLIQVEVIPHAIPQSINHFLHVEALISE